MSSFSLLFINFKIIFFLSCLVISSGHAWVHTVFLSLTSSLIPCLPHLCIWFLLCWFFLLSIRKSTQLIHICVWSFFTQNWKLLINHENNQYSWVSLADVVIHVVIQILGHTSLLISKVTTAADVITQHLRGLLTFTTEKLFLSAITTK